MKVAVVQLVAIGVLFALGGERIATGQDLTAQGKVAEISDDRIIVEQNGNATVSEGTEGQIFTTAQFGANGTQRIVTGAFRVGSVTGSLVIGRITDRSDLVDVAKGQNVSFQTGTSGGVGGTLAVRSTPSGASVQIRASEGSTTSPRSLGTTPAEDSVASGRYTVEVTKDGYRTVERTVRIRPGADRTLETSLGRREGFLVVRATPDTASVSVDGQNLGEGTVRDTLAAGEHRVQVEAAGYVSEKDTVQVTSAETRAIQPALERSTGTLKVRSEPQGAFFHLDGTKEGKTPMTKTLESGRHPIQLTKGNYKVFKDTVQVRGGAVRTVDVDLKRPLEVEMASAKGPVIRSEVTRVDDQLQIRYSLAGSAKAYDVELEFSHDGGETYRDVDHSKLQGDVGDEITPGQNKEIRWDVLEDYTMGLAGDVYRLRLVADEPFTGGFTIELLTPSEDLPSFGGSVLGWTTKNAYFVFSYSRIFRSTVGQGPTGFPVRQETTVNSFGLRAGPVWRLGWLSFRPVGGFAVRGGDFVTQGGSSVYIGRSFYVGSKVLYSTDFSGGTDWGAYLTMGVAL